MSIGLKRVDCQKLAEAKIKDAILLFENKRYSNAFYLAGYSIELALKACISTQFAPDTIPDKTFVKDIYDGHDLQKLVKLAGLLSELQEQSNKDLEFLTNWGLVGQWKESSRYSATDSMSTQFLLGAITDPNHGVLPWIKKFW